MSLLITQEYKKLNRLLHETNKDYGGHGGKWAMDVVCICDRYQFTELLDYGCGKAELANSLKETEITVHNYDPCITQYSVQPVPCDFVVCTDVLEHIEPVCLESVLDHIKGLTKKCVFFEIATRPAVKKLPDGRNTHLIQMPMDWWLEKLVKRWRVKSAVGTDKEFTALCLSR